MGLSEIADVDEIVDVGTVAHLDLVAALFGHGDDLAEVDGVAFAERGRRPQRNGQHRPVAGSAVGGQDVLLGLGFGESVDALLLRRTQDRQVLGGVEQVGEVVMDDG